MRVQAKQQRNQEAEAPINRIGWPLFTRAVGRSESRYGNIDPFIHSTTPVGLALGPDSPRDDERGPGTLGLPAAWSVRKPVREYRPVHPFDYACRPRLRTRLTQGRRTWPWNPWSSSGRDPHPALATHVCILTPTQSTAGFPRRFAPVWDALLPRNTTLHPRLRWRA